MKTSRFSETQIIAILKQGESGIKVKDLCREHGISDPTYDNWKAKYGRLEASDLKRHKETETELAKLKRMDADLASENRALKSLLEKKLSRRLTNGRRSRPYRRHMGSRSFGVARLSGWLGWPINKAPWIGRFGMGTS